MYNYNLDNLNNIDFLEELQSKVDKIEFHNDTNEANKVFLFLYRAIKDNDDKIKPELLPIYKKLLTKLRFILFLNLSDDDVMKLISRHLLVGLKMKYFDLLSALKFRISTIYVTERDKYKQKIIKVIFSNKEKITTHHIVVNNKKVEPTISNWIQNYNSYLGTGPKSELEQGKYFINNKDFIKLNNKEKKLLKKLFSIYEYLKRSSLTPEGNEDRKVVKEIGGKIYVMEDGKFIDVKTSEIKGKVREGVKLGPPKTEEEKKIEELKKIEEKYSDTSLEKKVLDEQIEKEQKLNELKYMATKYPEGSLERKAIEEEIKKMERK